MHKDKTLPVLYRSFHFLFVPYGSNYKLLYEPYIKRKSKVCSNILT